MVMLHVELLRFGIEADRILRTKFLIRMTSRTAHSCSESRPAYPPIAGAGRRTFALLAPDTRAA